MTNNNIIQILLHDVSLGLRHWATVSYISWSMEWNMRHNNDITTNLRICRFSVYMIQRCRHILILRIVLNLGCSSGRIMSVIIIERCVIHRYYQFADVHVNSDDEPRLILFQLLVWRVNIFSVIRVVVGVANFHGRTWTLCRQLRAQLCGYILMCWTGRRIMLGCGRRRSHDVGIRLIAKFACESSKFMLWRCA